MHTAISIARSAVLVPLMELTARILMGRSKTCDEMHPGAAVHHPDGHPIAESGRMVVTGTEPGKGWVNLQKVLVFWEDGLATWEELPSGPADLL